MLLLLLSHFSRVRLCVTPGMAAHQAPPSLGFSRKEHWGALPFLPPMHESEKWKWSLSVVSNPQRPHGLQPTSLLRPWDFPGRNTAAAAAKSLQSCPALCNPTDGSPPGFPSLGFSRQEHWSGLPFPSPMHESEKWKWSDPIDCSLPGSSVHGIF